MFWIIVGVVLLSIVLCSKININFIYTYEQDKQLIIIRMRFYGIKLLNKVIDLDEVENKDLWKNPFRGKTFLENLKQVDNFVHSIIETVDTFTMTARIFLRRIQVHKLEWNTFFGTGDASSTGIIAGGIWAVKGSLIGFIDTTSHLSCKPIMSVSPHFQRKYINSKFDCIVSIRIGQAMYALIKVIRKSSLKNEVYI
ncbi:DUF2953 domain-containing protein [Virgibacillus ndiopensis]|uniref:DUF2953 domain-containing protein n=1 Tax=Virgibacillus ndiopensis TaxID=2004408 RepID=UPI000C06F022|nr:DUF2953 domain-containing protein [Virgibacillus ndiopensis]